MKAIFKGKKTGIQLEDIPSESHFFPYQVAPGDMQYDNIPMQFNELFSWFYEQHFSDENVTIFLSMF